VGWDGVRNEPLNNASASGTHDHRCRLQLFCFLANYLTSIPFHDPSHSPHLFHRDHLNWTIKILKAPTLGNGPIFSVANLSIKPVSDKLGLSYIYIYIEREREREREREKEGGGRSYIYLAIEYPSRLSVVVTEGKGDYIIDRRSAQARFPLPTCPYIIHKLNYKLVGNNQFT
jgi:hypothetical protein